MHLTKSGGSCRLALEIGSHTRTQGGLIFDAISTSPEVALEASGLEFADAEWPALDDPLVRKAHGIVLRCRDQFGYSPVMQPRDFRWH